VRSFFREVLSLCLVLAMLTVGCMAGLCEETTASEEDDEVISFEPTFTNTFDYSAQEWFSSSLNRALLTMMLGADLIQVLDEETFILGPSLANTTFVAKDSVKLIVYFHAEQNDLMVFYTPVLGEAGYAYMEKSSDIVIQGALETAMDGGCYENNLEDILAISKVLAGES